MGDTQCTYMGIRNVRATCSRVDMQVDEEFRLVQKQLKQTTLELLRVYLKGKHPLKTDAAINDGLISLASLLLPHHAGDPEGAEIEPQRPVEILRISFRSICVVYLVVTDGEADARVAELAAIAECGRDAVIV